MADLTIRDIEIDDDPPLLLVGLGEYSDEEGLDVVFTANLRHNDYPENSNWPEGESYCVTNTEGLTSFGGVSEAEFHERSLRVLFTERTARVMELPDREMVFRIDAADVDLDSLSRVLKTIFTCGRPEYHPRLTGFPPGV
ncbi:hypothetical protein ACWD4O_13510 [Streptomyces sp. NPDC002623]